MELHIGGRIRRVSQAANRQIGTSVDRVSRDERTALGFVHEDVIAVVLQRPHAVQHESAQTHEFRHSAWQRPSADLFPVLTKELYALAPEGRIGHDKGAIPTDRERNGLDQAPVLVADRHELVGVRHVAVHAVDSVRSPIEDEKAAVFQRDEAGGLAELPRHVRRKGIRGAERFDTSRGLAWLTGRPGTRAQAENDAEPNHRAGAHPARVSDGVEFIARLWHQFSAC